MFKCSSCKAEFECEQCFTPVSGNEAAEDFLVFDGKELRSMCPKCGGMIYRTDEKTSADRVLAAVG